MESRSSGNDPDTYFLQELRVKITNMYGLVHISAQIQGNRSDIKIVDVVYLTLLTIGTMMMTSKMAIPTAMMIRIFECIK